MHDVLDLPTMLSDEFVQRLESGFAVEELREDVETAVARRDPRVCEDVLRRVEIAPPVAGWAFEEPSSLAAIRAAATRSETATDAPEHVDDRILAAWLGRCAGCNLGKPFEGWPEADIRSYLEGAGAFPLDDYAPYAPSAPGGDRLNASWPHTTRGRVAGMARDDDTDYTILGLHIMEEHGFDFGPEHVAQQWLEHFPFLTIYTAERAAYRNLILGIQASGAATFRNPYREWIGAQIRVDAYAYACAGDPNEASRLAFADASLSHTANGIYGAMWAAALIASAFTAADARAALDVAAGVVPARSRLAEALRFVDDLAESGADWETALAAIWRRYESLSFVHTINNAAIVAAALLWGDGDFVRTIGLAVQGGWDTDCNGATAGSVFGALHGTAQLSERFVGPLEDRIASAVTGFDGSRITDLARRTHDLAVARTGAIAATSRH